MEHMCVVIAAWHRATGKLDCAVEVWAADGKEAAKEAKKATKAMGYKFRYVVSLRTWDDGGKEMFNDFGN